jgi:hypothetical protein
LGSEEEKAYWKWASGYTRSTENRLEDSITAVEKLVDVGRPDAALNIAGDSHISLPSKLLQRLLVSLANLSSERKKYLNGTMLEFYLSNVFNQLYERNELSLEEIGKLEWPFAQVFDRLDRPRKAPLALHRTLQKDPAFFVELMSYVYKKDDGTSSRPKGLSDKQAQTLAENSSEVLHSWYLVPGVKEDGSVDGKALDKWVNKARLLSKENGFLKGCDLKLAEILSRIPPDKDGMWPHRALRETLEKVKSPILDKHIPYAIYNSRGVRSRGLFDGGKEEKKLSITYLQWSRAMEGKWPRTAKVLAYLSSMLDAEARREDVDSELRDLEF